MKTLTSGVSSFTFMPLGDKATSNLSVLKYFGDFWEHRLLEQVGPSVLYWPDTCGIHLHHRAKLQVKGLKLHTMRHYSIANLHRLRGVQGRMASALEALIQKKLVRKVGPAPEMAINLEVIIDLLFCWEAPHHNRKNNNKSQKIDDLRQLCMCINSNLLEDDLVHHCWDPATAKPCCKSRPEAVERPRRCGTACSDKQIRFQPSLGGRTC
jgi:hypothetical protein